MEGVCVGAHLEQPQGAQQVLAAAPPPPASKASSLSWHLGHHQHRLQGIIIIRHARHHHYGM
eukprot:757794-Rhodomonas_salina.1